MDKQSGIIQMFNDISPTYDRLNRILSFGVDRRWRKSGCEKALRIYGKPVAHLVDVATGTGDLILFWRRAAGKLGLSIEQETGIDPAVGMLDIARKKIPGAHFLEGQAASLPLKADSADIVSISYGIRNVVDLDRAMAEFYRVLKPGGLLMVLEFMSHKKKGWMERLSLLYMKRLLPAIGRLISKDPRAYTYLPESIEAFLSSEEMVKKLTEAGFELAQIHDESFKISTRFIARKPHDPA
jgi:demethylmenaquinone methyltransferase/2-methoxy-6-polyprenyl-1,4-benzoquinol methylase